MELPFVFNGATQFHQDAMKAESSYVNHDTKESVEGDDESMLEPQQEFNEDVEEFLMRPPPSFKKITSSHSDTKTNLRLPELKNVKKKLDPRPAISSVSSSSLKSKPSKKAAGAAPRAIDPEKLREAFAYADKISAELAALDFEDNQQSPTPRKEKDFSTTMSLPRPSESRERSPLIQLAKALGTTHSSNARPSKKTLMITKKTTKKKKKGSSGMTNKSVSQPIDIYTNNHIDKPTNYLSTNQAPVARSQQASPFQVATGLKTTKALRAAATNAAKKPSMNNPEEWNTNKSDASNGITGMDAATMDQLLANLQHGEALQSLRKQLSQSQESWENSRNVLQNAAKDFFSQKDDRS